jgi:transcriptional regulator
MYIPEHFRESRSAVLHDFIRLHSFGTLVSQVEGEPFATHLPFLLDAESGPHGTLRAHVARANPHWRGLHEDAQALVMFQGPHAYVSPSWYATPVAVPTWNYTAVHAYGRPRLVEDREALRALVDDTVRAYEGAYAEPWRLERLDAAVVEKMLDNIVGFEVRIERLEGKLKLGQNRSAADREGVIAALTRQGDEQSTAVATMMRTQP